MASDRTRVSKLMSWVLRHEPDAVGLTLDDGGWVDVETLAAALSSAGHRATLTSILDVVATSDKRRFELVGRRIRAAQGHSVPVDLGLEARPPPPVLWHGTVDRFLDRILVEGLLPMQRHAVHLSSDIETARQVGGRRGRPVLLRVDAVAMANAGYVFSRAANGAWLTETVPTAFLAIEPRA